MCLSIFYLLIISGLCCANNLGDEAVALHDGRVVLAAEALVLHREDARVAAAGPGLPHLWIRRVPRATSHLIQVAVDQAV